ncbi:hypothetical protein [Thetidibacter halocola]|uniref:Uncharacterized protein n=1 Tax=Thetidibacter halocola TaxID=2827239 RepID=A0A8J7WKT5_9RHOB|nr:hypothetical protein [Thetidibacter halocola]MBS0126834.1 hypothetical protein [Thetidibacter halocola]
MQSDAVKEFRRLHEEAERRREASRLRDEQRSGAAGPNSTGSQGTNGNAVDKSPGAQLDQLQEIAEGAASIAGGVLQETGSTIPRRVGGGTAAGPGGAAGTIVEGGRVLLDPNTGRATILRIEEGQGRPPNYNERRVLDEICQSSPDCVKPEDLKKQGYQEK